MPRDLFEAFGVDPNAPEQAANAPEMRDLFEVAQNNPESMGMQPSALQNIGSGIKGFAKGTTMGLGQGLGDVGASVGNIPANVIEYFTGKHLPHIPHPHLLDEPTGGISESIGRFIGQALPMAIPATAGVKAASLLSKAPGALRLLAGAGAGAGVGAATDEEHPGFGAATGALTAGAGVGIPQAIKTAQKYMSKNVTESIRNRLQGLQKGYGDTFNHVLKEGEKGGANKYLTHQPGNIKLLKQGATGKQKDLVYALEKYNANPTLENAHWAQSELGKYERMFQPQKNTKELDSYNEARKIKNRIQAKISTALEKSGAKDLDQTYRSAQQGYGTDVGPYLNSPAVQKLLAGNRMPKDFIKEIIHDKDFMAKLGEIHPELTKIKNIKEFLESPAGKALVHTGVGSAGIGVGLGVKHLLGW